MNFLYSKVPKYFSSFLGSVCQAWGSSDMKLTLNFISPSQMVFNLTFRKGMILLKFPRDLQVFNGYGTYFVSCPLVLAFHRDIMFEKRPRSDKDTPMVGIVIEHFPR